MIDWPRLRDLVRANWKASGLSQGKYGQQLGLSQGQISEIVTGKMTRPSAAVLDALRARFDATAGASSPPPADPTTVERRLDRIERLLAELLERTRHRPRGRPSATPQRRQGSGAPTTPPKRRRANGE